MKYKSFLIKYAEIGVKGKNRYLFEDALVKQIYHALKTAGRRFFRHKGIRPHLCRGQSRLRF